MYRFGRFTLDDQNSVLCADGRPIALARKVVEMLVVLVQRAGTVTPKEELLDRVWPDGFVEESNITQNVYLLRQAFRAHGLENAIETIPRRGYLFTLPVEMGPAGGPAEAPEPRFGSVAAAVAAFLLVFAIGNGVQSRVGGMSSAQRASGPGQRNALPARDAQLYGLGRYYWSLRTIAGMRRSVEYFSQVVHDAPKSALGYAGLSDAYLGLYDYQCESRGCPEIASRALQDASKAVTTDPSSAQGRTSLAMMLHVFEHKDAASGAQFERAIAADPRYALAHEWYGNMLLVQGRITQARKQLETAASLDPVSPATYGWLARAAYFQREYDDAIVYARRALSINPDRFETRVVLGLAYQLRGDNAHALSNFQQLARASDSVAARALLAGAYARVGRRSAAEKMLSSLDPANSDVAFAYIALRDYGTASADIKKVKFRNELERAFFRMDPRLDALRTGAKVR